MHKAGGILIKDRKFLVSRSRGKAFFIAPGGKLEPGETPEGALVRELREELGIEVAVADLELFGTFHAPAAGQEHISLQMDVFFVRRWGGKIQPSNEIEEVHWIGSRPPEGMALGSIFEHEVLPRLEREGMID